MCKRICFVIFLTLMLSSCEDDTEEQVAAASSGLQITVLNPGLTPADLVDILLGPDTSTTVSNTSYTGSNIQAGKFTGGTGIIEMESGILLGTGNIARVIGPNLLDNTTRRFGRPGDPDLDALVPGSFTADAAVLEFDFECPAGVPPEFNFLTLEYIFGSEEYNEFTNSPFNDVFSLFLNGVNIALLPNGVTPVAINTVNGGNPVECINGIDDDGDGLIDSADPDCTTPVDNIIGELNANSQFYRNNDLSDPDGGVQAPINIEADGLTVLVGAEVGINPGINHFKIAIADVDDDRFDSWLFLKEASFRCPDPKDGRMTGGGFMMADRGIRVSHGFELHCDAADLPNNLQVNWDKGNSFHLEELTTVFCADDPDLDPHPPFAEFDRYIGRGTGRYNGVPGATAEWDFTDNGQPGRSDFGEIIIRDADNNVVLTVSNFVQGGNHQAHKPKE